MRIGNLPLSKDALEALELAADEALRMGDGVICPDHLLLAVLRQRRFPWPRKPRLSYRWARRLILRAVGKEWMTDDIEITPAEAQKMQRERQAALEKRLKGMWRRARRKG